MNPDDYKPKEKGVSDKYSWLMYQRIKKKGFERVYLTNWHLAHGEQEINFSELKKGNQRQWPQVFIGNVDCQFLIGRQLRRVCMPGNSDYAFPISKALDITDWFWKEYKEKGRCLFFEYEHNWIAINKNSRRCEHCGKMQRREVKTVKTMKRINSWT